jgi:hypothetical protein
MSALAVAVATTSDPLRSSPATKAISRPCVTTAGSDELTGLGRPQELDVEIDGRRPLSLAERGDQRRTECVVKHRREHPSLDVAHRVEHLLGGGERDLDRARVRVDGQQFPAEQDRHGRGIAAAGHDVPERPSAARAIDRGIDLNHAKEPTGGARSSGWLIPLRAMADGDAHQGHKKDGARIGRRSFIGAGLAGAGALIVPAAPASARSAPARVQKLPGPNSGARATVATGGPFGQLPLRGTFPNLPAIPIDVPGSLDTLAKLQIRTEQVLQAQQGLTRKFTIRGSTKTAYAFLYGSASGATAAAARDALAKRLREQTQRALTDLSPAARAATAPAQAANTQPLSLSSARQFSISWTTFPDVYGAGRPFLSTWASSLTNADSATRQFWPTMAQNGLAVNLIVPERLTSARARQLRERFHIPWTRALRNALRAGRLYAIDMSRFESLQQHTVKGAVRFTPSTVTLLTHNPRTKTLTPVAIVVSGFQGKGRTVFTRATATNGAWLYALQAAKASIAVYGVWLGHVYQWHIVTAAMQMTMLNTLPTSHPVYQLLAPHSKFVIPFDNVLLSLWSSLAPPTSIASAAEFLGLANDFATGRSFFDDDPGRTLEVLRLRERDFTRKSAWDQYPIVRHMLRIWDLVAAYVSECVRATYSSDAAVASDRDLQAWMAAASSSDGSNIRGLPAMNSRAALEHVLTSLLYRVTIHGVGRLTSTSSPALTFVPNFPHCLQRADIPSPRTRLSTRTLLTYLPNVQTIGEAITFYFTFTFSTPYEPFIPLEGASAGLFFPGGPGSRRNRALIRLRNGLAAFMDSYQPGNPQRFQWPLNIET